MERFINGQRIKVINPDEENGLLLNKLGTVARIRISDGAAWVDMDEVLPEDLQSFFAGDSRAKHVKLYADECEGVAA